MARNAIKPTKEIFYAEVEFYYYEGQTKSITSLFGPYTTSGAANGQISRLRRVKYKVLSSRVIKGSVTYGEESV